MSTSDYQLADPILYALLRDYARENRNHPTAAESLLWERLRNGSLGKKFNRQHIIGPFIVDFVCLEIKLIIEVDGGYHSEPKQAFSDEERTAELNKLGFWVIRFDNEEIIHNIDQVIQNICKYF